MDVLIVAGDCSPGAVPLYSWDCHQDGPVATQSAIAIEGRFWQRLRSDLHDASIRALPLDINHENRVINQQ